MLLIFWKMQELSLVSSVHLWWKKRDQGTGTVPFWQLGSCLHPTSLKLLWVNHLNGDPMRTSIFHPSISSLHSVSALMEENHFWGDANCILAVHIMNWNDFNEGRYDFGAVLIADVFLSLESDLVLVAGHLLK